MVFPGDAELQRDQVGSQADRHGVTVVGIYASAEATEHALNALHDAGFSRDDLSVVARNTDAADEIPSQAAAERASTGGGVGALLGAGTGGALGALIGTGALVIPGIGPLVAAGWLATALGGAAVGAGAGAWIGSMVNIGVPENVAERYQEQISQGRYLLMVRTTEGEQDTTAQRVLRDAGAEDVQSYPYQARPDRVPGSNPEIQDDLDSAER